jgi:hypothetical protein
MLGLRFRSERQKAAVFAAAFFMGDGVQAILAVLAKNC